MEAASPTSPSTVWMTRSISDMGTSLNISDKNRRCFAASAVEIESAGVSPAAGPLDDVRLHTDVFGERPFFAGPAVGEVCLGEAAKSCLDVFDFVIEGVGEPELDRFGCC